MKYKVLKDFTHNGLSFIAGEHCEASEFYDGAIDGLLSVKFIEKVKKNGKSRNSKSAS